MTRALLALLLVTGVASADDIVLPRTKAILHLPAGWSRVDAPGVVAGYRSPARTGADDQLVAAVTRAQVANPDAWRPTTRDAYAEQIERGALAVAPGQRRLARKLGDANGIPALDLELRRADGATLVVRILLYRTYALALAIEVPKAGSIDEARGIARQFAPPKSP